MPVMERWISLSHVLLLSPGRRETVEPRCQGHATPRPAGLQGWWHHVMYISIFRATTPFLRTSRAGVDIAFLL
jgi:hypothetical protein